MSQAIVDALPLLTRDGVCLREIELFDATELLALFSREDVSAHLDPPPATLTDFNKWIALTQSRRAEGRAACYVLLADEKVAGLFMALRLVGDDRAEIGFALSPALWGTGVFLKAVHLYLEFLFNTWGLRTLVGRTQIRNLRGVGAMRKLGATVIEESIRNDQPEYVWTLERPSTTSP